MKLARESQAHVERFLREHLRDEELRLPPILIYSGWWTKVFTRAFNIGAMTLGRRIIVAPSQIVRDVEGRKTLAGRIVVHEAMHVWQYGREGATRFLLSYLRGFWGQLRASGGWNGAARLDAYLAIPEEMAAREAETAYREWSDGTTLRLKVEYIEEENYSPPER